MLKEKIDNIFNKRLKYETYPEIPKNMLVELSNNCNSNCLFCCNSKMTRHRGEIDFDFLSKILDEAISIGITEVGFYTTGEPLLYSKINEAVSYSKKIGFKYIYITTNGILAEKNKIEELVKSGLNSIKFSINAITRNDYKFIHGVDKFDQVIKNLKEIYELRKIKNLDFKIFVSYIATKYTDYGKIEITDFFRNYCDEIIVVNVRNQSGMMPLETKKLKCKVENDKVQAARLLPCHYLFNVLNISYEGYLTGCCTDFQNYLAYANLHETSIEKAWHNDVVTNLRIQHLKGVLDNNLCYNCINHSLDLPQPLCKEYATIFDKQCYCNTKKFNKRFLERNDKNGIC